MHQEIRSTALGMVTGLWIKTTTGDVALALGMAFLTGGAAYLGQLTIKFIWDYLKSKFK